MVDTLGMGTSMPSSYSKTEEEKQKAMDVVDRMVKKAISLDGPCSSFVHFFFPLPPRTRDSNSVVVIMTGEHGVGIGKKEYLIEELGEGTMHLMKTIKKVIDPLGIFNPGKVCTVTLQCFFLTLFIGYFIIALSGRSERYAEG
jgi:hypothetical protein